MCTIANELVKRYCKTKNYNLSYNINLPQSLHSSYPQQISQHLISPNVPWTYSLLMPELDLPRKVVCQHYILD